MEVVHGDNIIDSARENQIDIPHGKNLKLEERIHLERLSLPLKIKLNWKETELCRILVFELNT